MDGDGIFNFADTDADGNGIANTDEAGPLADEPVDTDSDGIADYLDVDNDADGLFDTNDGDPLTRIQVANPLNENQRLMILDAIGMIGGRNLRNVARIGGQLTITGIGFSPVVGENTVVFFGDGTQGYRRGLRRRPRERAELAQGSARPEAPRSALRAGVGRRRRRARFLEGAAQGLRPNDRAGLLGTQDRQRPEL